jgi:IMP dehydrogenase
MRETVCFDDVLLVPNKSNITSRKEVDLSTQLTKKIRIKYPIISAPMDCITESSMIRTMKALECSSVAHRFCEISEQSSMFKNGNETTICAIGLKDYKERVKILYDLGCRIFLIDIAHGYTPKSAEILVWIKKTYVDAEVIVGNIASKEAAEYFMSCGADALRVGVGGGSMCTTRSVTGFGVPTLESIMDVYSVTQDKIPIIADGGIRTSGDAVKAFVAGADTVMLGGMLAGTEETPGRKYVGKDGKVFKLARGMASTSAYKDKKLLDKEESDEFYMAEGIETTVPYRGSVVPIVNKFIGGIKSGFSYAGCRNFKELKFTRIEMVGVSPLSMTESNTRL